MSCFGGKRKPGDTKPTETGRPGVTNSTVVATRQYGADDFEPSSRAPQPNQFVSTGKIPIDNVEHIDRQENYANEPQNANVSKLIEDKNVLNYDLDDPEGVSAIPIINTFHYERVLNHCFFFSGDAESRINRNSAGTPPQRNSSDNGNNDKKGDFILDEQRD